MSVIILLIGKSGNSRVITIPSYFLRSKLISPKKEYKVILKEVDKNVKERNRVIAD